MALRRNPIFIPWLAYWAGVVILGGFAAYGGIRYVDHLMEEAHRREQIETRKQLGKAGGFLGLAGVGIGVIALAVKGGMNPPRMPGG